MDKIGKEFVVTPEILEHFKNTSKVTISLVKQVVPNFKEYQQCWTIDLLDEYKPTESSALENAVKTNVILTKRDFIDGIEASLHTFTDDDKISVTISDDYVEVYTTKPSIRYEEASATLNRIAKAIRTKLKELNTVTMEKKTNITDVISKQNLSNEEIKAMIERLQGMIK